MKANAAIDWQTFILFTSVHILARAIAAIDWQTLILVTSVRVLTRTIYCCKGKTTIIIESVAQDQLDLRDVIALEISFAVRILPNGLKFWIFGKRDEQKRTTPRRDSIGLFSFTLLSFKQLHRRFNLRFINRILVFVFGTVYLKHPVKRTRAFPIVV